MDVVVENTGDFLRSGWPRFVCINTKQAGRLARVSNRSGAVFNVSSPMDLDFFLSCFDPCGRDFALKTLSEETEFALLKLRGSHAKNS